MNTIKTYFNTEKEKLNPNVRDFAMILDTLKQEEKIISPVRVFSFDMNTIMRSTYFRYSFSLVSVAAAFVIFLVNKDTLNTPSDINNVRLAQNTVMVASKKSTKQEEVKNAISTIDDIKSFDAEN